MDSRIMHETNSNNPAENGTLSKQKGHHMRTGAAG